MMLGKLKKGRGVYSRFLGSFRSTSNTFLIDVCVADRVAISIFNYCAHRQTRASQYTNMCTGVRVISTFRLKDTQPNQLLSAY